MSESKIAGIIIALILALMPIGFILFGSRFIPIAPLVIVFGISVFGVIHQRKKRKRKQELKHRRDELLKARWESDHE